MIDARKLNLINPIFSEDTVLFYYIWMPEHKQWWSINYKFPGRERFFNYLFGLSTV